MIHSNSNDHQIRQVLVDGSVINLLYGGSGSDVVIELFVRVVKLLEPLEVSRSLTAPTIYPTSYTVSKYICTYFYLHQSMILDFAPLLS